MIDESERIGQLEAELESKDQTISDMQENISSLEQQLDAANKIIAIMRSGREPSKADLIEISSTSDAPTLEERVAKVFNAAQQQPSSRIDLDGQKMPFTGIIGRSDLDGMKTMEQIQDELHALPKNLTLAEYREQSERIIHGTKSNDMPADGDEHTVYIPEPIPNQENTSEVSTEQTTVTMDVMGHEVTLDQSGAKGWLESKQDLEATYGLIDQQLNMPAGASRDLARRAVTGPRASQSPTPAVRAAQARIDGRKNAILWSSGKNGQFIDGVYYPSQQAVDDYRAKQKQELESPAVADEIPQPTARMKPEDARNLLKAIEATAIDRMKTRSPLDEEETGIVSFMTHLEIEEWNKAAYIVNEADGQFTWPYVAPRAAPEILDSPDSDRIETMDIARLYQDGIMQADAFTPADRRTTMPTADGSPIHDSHAEERLEYLRQLADARETVRTLESLRANYGLTGSGKIDLSNARATVRNLEHWENQE